MRSLSLFSRNTIADCTSSGHLPILRLLVPLLTPEQLLLRNLAGDTAADLAEERGTEQTLECAGYIEGQLPEDPKEEEGVTEEPVTNGDGVAEDVKKLDLSDKLDSRQQSGAS